MPSDDVVRAFREGAVPSAILAPLFERALEYPHQRRFSTRDGIHWSGARILIELIRADGRGLNEEARARLVTGTYARGLHREQPVSDLLLVHAVGRDNRFSSDLALEGSAHDLARLANVYDQLPALAREQLLSAVEFRVRMETGLPHERRTYAANHAIRTTACAAFLQALTELPYKQKEISQDVLDREIARNEVAPHAAERARTILALTSDPEAAEAAAAALARQDGVADGTLAAEDLSLLAIAAKRALQRFLPREAELETAARRNYSDAGRLQKEAEEIRRRLRPLINRMQDLSLRSSLSDSPEEARAAAALLDYADALNPEQIGIGEIEQQLVRNPSLGSGTVTRLIERSRMVRADGRPTRDCLPALLALRSHLEPEQLERIFAEARERLARELTETEVPEPRAASLMLELAARPDTPEPIRQSLTSLEGLPRAYDPALPLRGFGFVRFLNPATPEAERLDYARTVLADPQRAREAQDVLCAVMAGGVRIAFVREILSRPELRQHLRPRDFMEFLRRWDRARGGAAESFALPSFHRPYHAAPEEDAREEFADLISRFEMHLEANPAPELREESYEALKDRMQADVERLLAQDAQTVRARNPHGVALLVERARRLVLPLSQSATPGAEAALALARREAEWVLRRLALYARVEDAELRQQAVDALHGSEVQALRRVLGGPTPQLAVAATSHGTGTGAPR